MLEQRVARLEQMLERLEPKIGEILSSGAKQADLQRVQIEIAELKGRLSGVEGRLSALPSTWTMLGIVFTTWALGSGILIFALNVLRR
jgi:chromosome segregation ATPase